MDKYPTLSLIDGARGLLSRPFALGPNAEVLERLARELADASWSELTWLTGCISHHALEAVCRRLDQHRLQPAVTGSD